MSSTPSKSGAGPRRSASARQSAGRAEEPVTQVTLKMRESLHRDLTKKAFNSGMTMRGFIMRALQQAGLRVTEGDLIDGRKRGTGR